MSQWRLPRPTSIQRPRRRLREAKGNIGFLGTVRLACRARVQERESVLSSLRIELCAAAR